MLNNPYKVLLPALRSGEYAQARGVLYDGNGLCCLGVADMVCFGAEFYRDVYGDDDYVDDTGHSIDLSTERTEALRLDKVATEEEKTKALQIIEVTTSREFGDNHPVTTIHKNSDRQNVLMALNDGGATFVEIADFIEWAGWNKEGLNND